MLRRILWVLTCAVACTDRVPAAGDGGDGSDGSSSGETGWQSGSDSHTTEGTGSEGTSGEIGETGAAIGECLPPDAGLAPVPESQVASTQAAYACMAWVDCACDERSHETVPSCRHSWAMTFVEIRDDAQAAGLTYDGLCLAQHVADLEELGCTDAPTDDAWSVIGAGRCSIYHGDRVLGETCTSVGASLSDCQQGLACWDGVCVDPCGVDQVGDRCGGLFGFACPGGTKCFADTCMVPPPPAAIGEPCGGGTTCDASGWCREDCEGESCSSTCAAKVADGLPCIYDVECASEFCAAAVCQVGPLTREPCVEGRCLAGRECIDGLCGPPEGVVCESA